jgi:diadenosine tetraphosphate (Ap4A) HIT family hydrolase
MDFKELTKTLENLMIKTFRATMFNWSCLLNDAYLSRIPNPHVHWHFRPRYDHDVKFAEITFKDPDFGYHYNRERKQKLNEIVRGKIIKKLKENLKGKESTIKYTKKQKG